MEENNKKMRGKYEGQDGEKWQDIDESFEI